jgi:hypothetical protein
VWADSDLHLRPREPSDSKTQNANASNCKGSDALFESERRSCKNRANCKHSARTMAIKNNIAQLLTNLRDSWRIDVPWAGEPRTSTGAGDERGDNAHTWRERRLTGVDERGDENVHTWQRGDLLVWAMSEAKACPADYRSYRRRGGSGPTCQGSCSCSTRSSGPSRSSHCRLQWSN